MTRRTFGPRQRELLAKAAERGPWRVGNGGRVRNAVGQCPIEAAREYPPNQFYEGHGFCGVRESTAKGVMDPADSRYHPRRPELLRLLGVTDDLADHPAVAYLTLSESEQEEIDSLGKNG